MGSLLVQKFLELGCGHSLEKLKMQDGEGLECFKWSLVSDSGRTSDNQNGDRNTES